MPENASLGTGDGKKSGRPASDFRVVYALEWDLSVDNGPGINERELIDELARQYGEQFHCVVPQPRYPDRHSNPRISYAAPHRKNIVRYCGYLLSTYRHLRRIRKEVDPNAYVFRMGATPILPYIVCKTFGRPVILKKLDLHSIFGQQTTRGRIKNAISKSFQKMYRAVLQCCIGADVETPGFIDWTHEHFGMDRSRMTVIRNGANTRHFAPKDRDAMKEELGLARFDHIVGYVGALSRLRNVDSLLRAVGRLELPGRLGLVLLGDGPQREELEELGRSSLGDGLVPVGQVDYQRVPDWTACFDVGVDLTAVKLGVGGRNIIASFSQKIPQYLASGTPVIAWDCADTGFLERDRIGRAVPYGDEEALASALREILECEPDARRGRRERARRVAEERFSVQVLAQQRFEWWKELVEREGEVAIPEGAAPFG